MAASSSNDKWESLARVFVALLSPACGDTRIRSDNGRDEQPLKRKHSTDLKNLLNAWRHRLPNDWEDMSMWEEIFSWRSQMFSAITSNFNWSEPNKLASLHDRPWTAIRLAKTARKQDMRDVALLLLSRAVEERAMNVSDAFLKLREQILVYDNPDSDLERTGG